MIPPVLRALPLLITHLGVQPPQIDSEKEGEEKNDLVIHQKFWNLFTNFGKLWIVNYFTNKCIFLNSNWKYDRIALSEWTASNH